MSRKTYPKSRGAKVQSVVALVAILAVGADLLCFAGGHVPLASFLLLGLFLCLSIAFLVSAFFDVYTFDGKEVAWENRAWSMVGFSAKRSLSMSRVASIREHKGRTLFVKGDDGSRFVIDAVAEYQDLRDRLLHAHQALSADKAARDRDQAPPGNGEAPVLGG